MSATINRFCTVKRLDDIKKLLVPEEETRQEALRDDDWDNRWNWDTSELVYNNEDDANRCHTWLADCKIALSPFTDMFVIGRGNILTIFNYKRNSTSSSEDDSGTNEFNLIYDTSLPGLEPGETITSIVLLPFVSQQKSSVNCRDWTAILIGFSTGFFRIYAENGKVLMTHLFHAEQILDIKCRTYCANSLLAEQLDEIMIIYPTAVIQIDGFTLYQTLRLCRNHLAKSQHVDSAGQGFFQNLADSSGSSSHTPFTFKKWAFETLSDGQIQDCVDVCTFVKNDFDALVSHSITNQPLNNSTANLFMTTGTNPFVGFYRTQEGTTHTIIQELSQVLFNKVKNVFSFLSQSKPKESDPREMIKPATNVDCNLGLYDERLGFKICLSPNRRLAAVVDDFGRVTLFDLQNSIPIRIWKGYRRAEVGWIVVDESDSTKGTASQQQYCKQAHFLVIYAPKRGILEIWCAQNGPRVTAFNVGKNCQLLYMDHVMFGLNHLILQNIKQSMKSSQFIQTFSHSKCFLFNYETGELFNINIPFLCALTDRNGKKTRDIHILKDLKSLLSKYKENVGSEEKFSRYRSQLVALVLMLKTAEIRREFLEELIKMSDDSILIKHCASELHQDLIRLVERNQLDFENKLVAQMCVRIIQICDFYIKIREKLDSLIESIGHYCEESQSPPDIYQLTENLTGWNGNDIARILSLLAFRQSVLKQPIQQGKIKEEVNFDFSVSELLSHFTLYYSHLIKKNNVEIYEKLPIEIVLMNGNTSPESPVYTTAKESATYVSLDRLSRFLFNATFCGDESNLDSLLNNCCVFPSNLLLLLFTGWLSSSFSNYWPCWPSFHRALFQIVQVMNDLRQSEDDKDNLFFDSSNFDDRLLSPGWTDIVELIYKSENITSSLISVNMIKALINRFKLDQKDLTELKMNNKCSQDLVLPGDDDDDEEDQQDNGLQDLPLEKSLTSSDNEWETLHLDKENLSLLTKQLEDLFLLDMLLKSNLCSIESQLLQQQQQQQQSNPDNPDNESKLFLELRNQLQFNLDNLSKSNTISLSYILNSGPGIVSEIVARWAVFHKIEPELLICQPGMDANDLNEDKESVTIAQESRELKRTVEGSTSAVSGTNYLTDQSTLMDILEHVRRCFPNCLESDILLINCGWELLLQWHRQPLIFSGELSLTLGYLNQVSSSVLKHNVASLGWRLFIQKRFEILCNLIEKMGKKPKDRICRKDLNMDENTLEQFVTFCCEFLDFMIRTSLYSEMEPLPLYSIDEWWCGFNASNDHTAHYDQQTSMIQTSDSLSDLSSSTQQQPMPFASNAPLAVLAMHQKSPNVDLLIEYHRLAMAVQFSVLFSLKGVRPLSLFPSTVRAYFFKDLHSFISTSSGLDSKPMPTDPVLLETRFRFISNLITAIVQTLPVYQNENDRDEGIKFYLVANKWFGKIVDLAREWGLDVDKIRLRYVYDLFLFGCDPLAEELLTTVTDVKGLGRQLLVIAGMRLMAILNNRFTSLDEVSFLPPNIIFWLKSLVTDANCYGDCPPSATVLLLEHIGNFLHDDSSNGRICEELLSAMQNQVLTGSMD